LEHVLNWVWQASLLVLASTGCARMARHGSAALRYRLWSATLIAVLAVPMVDLRLRSAPAVSGTSVDSSLRAIEIPFMLQAAGPAIAIAWAAWVVVALGRVGTAWLLLRRVRSGCIPFPAAREARLSYWRAVRDTGRRATLAVSPAVRSAAVLGGRRTTIAVSPRLLRHLNDGELDRIVLHEWAHVQRRDDRALLLQQLVSAIVGLHPAVWWSTRQLQLERELACDEHVVRLTGSPKRYAACLVRLATLIDLRTDVSGAPAALARPQLATRITRLVRQAPASSPSGASAWITGSAVLLLATFGVALQSPLFVAPAGQPMPPVAAAEPVSSTAASAAAGDLELQSDGKAGSALAPQARVPGPRASPVTLPSNASAPGLTRVSGAPAAARASPPRPGRHEDPPAIERLTVDHTSLSSLPGAAVTMAPPPSPAPSRQALTSETPWSAAAGAGIAIGRGSTRAARATAGFFARMGKSIAGDQ
jgi:beta-lactamase regulating signal transducer with metallopeptidase domain